MGVAAPEHLREVVAAGELDGPERAHVNRSLGQPGEKRGQALVAGDRRNAIADARVGRQARRGLRHHARLHDLRDEQVAQVSRNDSAQPE